MSRFQALFFAVVGVCLLLAISFSISLRSIWLVLLFTVLSVCWTGFGFVTKAKARKRNGG